MASWNEPNNSDPNHVDVLQQLQDKDTYSATMGQSGTYTDRPEGTMLWDNVAALFRRLTGGIESIVKLSIAGGGTGGGTASEARTNLGVSESGTGSNQVRTNSQNEGVFVSQSRTINTTSPLQGGADLDEDLTLSIQGGSVSQKGVLQLNNTLASASIEQALTAAQGKALNDFIVSERNKVLSLKVDYQGGASYLAKNVSDSGAVWNVIDNDVLNRQAAGIVRISGLNFDTSNCLFFATGIDNNFLNVVVNISSASSIDVYIRGISGALEDNDVSLQIIRNQ